ncbi:MAG: tannase/feruloyl esterase family alpha/beta hydrolase [Alphaproteobacteria bacterium]|nr:tannase/feruloyl esterase family alpha/beta hydrolase [Alphaproteobacteria bacterium]
MRAPLIYLWAIAGLLLNVAQGSAEPLPPFDPGKLPFDKRIPLPDLSPFPVARCTGLTALALPHGRIDTAHVVPAGSYHPPGTPPDFILPGLPKFCRVAGQATPTRDSLIKFEVWIPIDGSYRQRYLQAGNGGFSGAIVYTALAEGIRRGYATASTDDGNQEAGSAAFAAGHPQKVIDYGHRSLKETTDKAKHIVSTLMGRGPDRSYFHGCSNGGRQALMEAQRFPEDFDGIAVGAPANYYTHQFASFAWNAQQIYPAAGGPVEPRLHASRVPILSNAVRAQCAGHDGGLASDKFLTNPPACQVKLAPLQCAGLSTDGCLTSTEIGIVQRIYAGPTHAVSGQQIYPGLEPGAEGHPFNWPLWVTGLPKLDGSGSNLSAQALFGWGFFGYFVHGSLSYDIRTLNFSTDIDQVDADFGPALNAIDPDLTPFYDRRGKLLQYHGFDDAAVAPRNSINYWGSVWAKMKQVRPALRRSDFDGFYRLFMVPGLGHCEGGAGANEFGNGVRGSALDAEHDLMLALERWVEHGVAPDRIIARHRGPNFERPLCPYPQLPRYNGVGNPNLATSWSCSIPPLIVKPNIFLPKQIWKTPVPLPPLPKQRFKPGG